MSIKALQEYTRVSKYARYIPTKQRRETWPEQVERVMSMHRRKFEPMLPELLEDFELVQQCLLKKEILGSQRGLQFGGAPVERINTRIYNCAATYVDRVRVFQEAMFVLLCGTGAGFSVQFHHIQKVPKVAPINPDLGKVNFTVQDNIEGWSDAIGALVSSYFVSQQSFPEFAGRVVEFDYSQVRPEGSPISHGGKAPGPKGLAKSIEKVRAIFDKATANGTRQLKSIEIYDIIMHISDSVLSGGIRRSATICLFSPSDVEMATAKTGDWHIANPQRGRSNNSAVLVRNNTTREQFATLIESVKDCGEPGFVWSEDTEVLYNPCVEIGLYGYDEQGNSGWEFCNLTELNMKKAKTKEDYFRMCKAGAIIGTLQAAYTDFGYLGDVTRRIVEREALLGVSMTGMMDNAEIAFDPELQRQGAAIVLAENERIAKIIGINLAARTTCVKPSGNSAAVLGVASGVHPQHAKRYFRHVQANKNEPALKFFMKYNPDAVEESVWSSNRTDVNIKFLCEVPPSSRTKSQVGAIELLDHVQLTQQNWVEAGTRPGVSVQPWLRHNVSNTITVKPDEWGAVEEFIYTNRAWFAGISLLPMSGDKDYAQAPYTAVYTPTEIVKEYGDGSIFASGLVVDGKRCFHDDLWAGCATVLGIGAIPLEVYRNPNPYIDEKMSVFQYQSPFGAVISMSLKKFRKQKDWVRRAFQFADRYFDGDTRKMTYCLKDVRNWKVWCDLTRTYQVVPWEEFTEDDDNTTVSESVACAGGACEIL